ncbi:hypothetical protein CGGC5_v013132 [Colletotrichum fructicola Nara gc5]|uniref:Fungal N-terminal domain-containing protein n=1 Tax=Colletotrichum fructicola (strain Nara gc5) TaxID=1213859 RepID=A0A7J6INF6_COLFN|nr:hypothetical protein CFRS1_v015309 [Colletotrichum fructicola]KAF4478243.1 hypothetical protein CGGC5_v013132 [Colletotrichum fructicola Nara gc5]
MDPFSITVGVVGLIGTSSKIITSLKGVADSSKGIDGRLRVLISEVEVFKAMLESTRATLDSDEIQHILQATAVERQYLSHFKSSCYVPKSSREA